MTDKVYLVDGSGYIFRAYYAIAPLTSKEGFPTNALFGFTRMVLKLLQQADAEHVVMVFDAGRKTFRNDLYAEYKANRDECPEDLVQQMPYFREISKALGLPILELPGYEADDIIGTLATRLAAEQVETVIVSGDKDLLQLVGNGVSVWDTMRDRRFGPEQVVEKLGVAPEQVVEFLGLTGDSSDNIPGLKGVGPKTAIQLIEKFGTVEKILQSVDLIREDSTIRNRKKISEAIESDPELLRLSRRLVQVEQSAPLELGAGEKKTPMRELETSELLAGLSRCSPDKAHLLELVEKFNFTSLVSDLNLDPPSQSSVLREEVKYRAVFAEDFESWLADFKQQQEFSFDLETTSLDVLEAQIVGAAFCWDSQEAFYIPFSHPVVPGKDFVELSHFVASTRLVFEDKTVKKICQNGKYDISVLAAQKDPNVRIQVEGLAFDTMIAAYLLRPDKAGYGLTALAREFLGHNMIEYQDLVDKDSTFQDVPVDKATEYACEDAHITWLLREQLQPKIEEFELEQVLYEIEVPLVGVLSAMEREGVKLNMQLFASMSEELAKKLEHLKVELHEMAGCEFNVNSPKQLSEILFDRLGIPTKGVKKTKTGFSTNFSVLDRLSHEYPLPALVLKYRGLHKLKSTYVDVLPAQVHARTGRLHTRFNQTVTGTGRLSSSDPNLQNIPIMTAEGRRVREGFIAESGRVLISADYSQIELRLLAHLSEDEILRQAFIDDLDIHSNTARELLEIPEDEEISTEDRRIGKTINFGIIYGMSGFRLGRDLGIPVGVANQYIEDYFAKFPRVQRYYDAVEENMEKLGYVTTIFGRKRFISEIDTAGRDRGFARRAAMNAPMQGSAADVIKLAMIRLQQRILEEKLPLQMLLQIHDELVFECDEGFIDNARNIIRSEMESAVQLSVPIKVDVGVGKNWQEAH